VGIGPATSGAGPQLVFGGLVPAALRRMARYGDGWILGAGVADAFREGASAARQAWAQAGRDGVRRLLALGYFALGEGGADHARDCLGHYYAFAGLYAERVAAWRGRRPARSAI
jgi:alkanesulfonate monooxygenase SsuD/methylene tetrahydromethanopterin reductase-like flavin-dependent oxidoreductase (luciferase family)